MKQKIRQILYDLRHQPIIAWVTLIATAMSIFLIMVVVIIQRSKVIPFPPESNRDRLLIGQYIHVYNPTQQSEMSSSISYQGAKELYGDLDGVEHVSYVASGLGNPDVKGTTNEIFTVNPRFVDSEFFNIFDHQLIEGRYFTPEETESDLPLAIISESTARRAFGSTECIGEKLFYNYSDYYTVVGVVKDTSPLARFGYADVFINSGPTNSVKAGDTDGGINQWFGGTDAIILVKKGVDFEHIRDQVKARYAVLNSKLAEIGFEAFYHQSPFDTEVIASGYSASNIDPDLSSQKQMRYLLFAILLIVPAINLSGMLHSRMRRRVSEIGVRRAFGCTRRRIITDIISENFIVTLIGGIAGLVLGIIFASTYDGLYDSVSIFGNDMSGVTPPLSAILNWGTILIALGVCFLLNLVSAAIPAWQASRLSVVNAINAK